MYTSHPLLGIADVGAVHARNDAVQLLFDCAEQGPVIGVPEHEFAIVDENAELGFLVFGQNKTSRPGCGTERLFYEAISSPFEYV